MATGALISVSEYLSTSYSPDCDYVDGVVEERNLGEHDHARLTMKVAAYFYQPRKRMGNLCRSRTACSGFSHPLSRPRCLCRRWRNRPARSFAASFYLH